MSYQVVHCKTQEEWDFAAKKLGRTDPIPFLTYDRCCINLNNPNCSYSETSVSRYTKYSFEEWCEMNNYTPDFLKKTKKYTKEELLNNHKLIVYLNNQEEWERLNKFLGFKVTTMYCGNYCYNPKKRSYSGRSNKISPGGYSSDSIILTLDDLDIKDDYYKKNETIEQLDNIKPWSKGTYIVIINDYHFVNIGDIHRITGGGYDNNVDISNSVGKICMPLKNHCKWFKTKLEAEEFAKNLSTSKIPEKKFEVGKWYKNVGKKQNYIAKFEKYWGENTKKLKCTEYIYNNKYCKSSSGYLQINNKTEEISLKEIQEYLPEGHPDKIKENKYIPKVGDWIWGKPNIENKIMLGKVIKDKGCYYQCDFNGTILNIDSKDFHTIKKAKENEIPKEYVKCIKTNGTIFILNKKYKVYLHESTRVILIGEDRLKESYPLNGTVWKFEFVDNDEKEYSYSLGVDYNIYEHPVEPKNCFNKPKVKFMEPIQVPKYSKKSKLKIII
jgi:hypothetical protein